MGRPRSTWVLIAALLILVVSVPQLGHLVRFGHFLAIGLHADLVVRKADYGIEGITKAYEAKLTNYGIAPINVTACDFIDDTLSQGAQVGYTVERWDTSAGKWEDIFKGEESAFCQPYPLGIIEAHIVVKRLWPGQSISTGAEATAARDSFGIGDKARFKVFAGNERTFPTSAFSIDEHQTRPEVPYRVRH